MADAPRLHVPTLLSYADIDAADATDRSRAVGYWLENETLDRARGIDATDWRARAVIAETHARSQRRAELILRLVALLEWARG